MPWEDMKVGSPTLPDRQARIARNISPYLFGLLSPVKRRIGKWYSRMASHERSGLPSGRIAVAALPSKIDLISGLNCCHRPGPLSSSTYARMAASRSPLAMLAASRSRNLAFGSQRAAFRRVRQQVFEPARVHEDQCPDHIGMAGCDVVHD